VVDIESDSVEAQAREEIWIDRTTFVNAEPNADLPGEDFQLSQPEVSQLIQMPGSALKH
jgi:hypothetical protein